MSSISLLTSIDSTSHIHLIIGSNPLAAARCAKSIEVGAKPLLIAPETAELHYSLQKRIDNREVNWLKKSFDDEDILRHGREEIGGVVDAVFVTSSPRDPLSRDTFLLAWIMADRPRRTHLPTLQTKPSSRECSRRVQSLHLLSSFHTHRWTPSNRCNNEWQRM